jgi:hypothetical protein
MPFAGLVTLLGDMLHQLRLAELDHFPLSIERVADNTIVQMHALRKQGLFRVQA